MLEKVAIMEAEKRYMKINRHISFSMPKIGGV